MSLDNFPNQTQVTGELYSLRVIKATTPVAVASGAEYTLLNFTGQGKLVSLWTNFENDKHQIVFIIDGVEVERFQPKNYNDFFVIDDASKKATDMWSDNKLTNIKFIDPCDFATSVQVRVKNLDNNTKDLIAFRLEYRQKTID